MIKLIFIALFLFLLSGCTATNSSITEYKIALKTQESNNLSGGCIDKSLKVVQAFSPSSLMSLQMNYVQGESKVYAYSQARWSNSPNKEISSQMLKVLRESKLFKNTQNSKSRSKSNLILETNIEEFMQYYSKDLTESYSYVVISLTLIDAYTSEVLATKTFSAKSDVETLDASGGVNGLGNALSDVLNQSLNFLNEVCK